MAKGPIERFFPETFRPRAAIRATVLLADTLWLVVLVVLLVGRGGTAEAVLSSFFFIVLFTGCAAFYERFAVTVSDRGLVLRTLVEERVVAFSDILRVDVLPGLVGTSYSVRTRRGAVRFDSLLEDHERLCALIVQGAGLSAR